MNVVIDTSAIVAVITNEASKPKIIDATMGSDLIAPESIHWEIGNALSAMLKRKLISFENAISAVKIYKKIPIRFVEIELETAVTISNKLGIYAYDAYLLASSLKYKASLLTLDQKLSNLAVAEGIDVIKFN